MIQVGSRVKAAVDLFPDGRGASTLPMGSLGTVVSRGVLWDWIVLFDGCEFGPDPVDSYEIEEA